MNCLWFTIWKSNFNIMPGCCVFCFFFHYNEVFRQNRGGCVRFECLSWSAEAQKTENLLVHNAIFCWICYPIKAIKAFQIQKRYQVWMNKYEKRAYGKLESFWWACMSEGLQNTSVSLLHCYGIKSPAPLRIRVQLITFEQQNTSTINAKTDFPDRWLLQKRKTKKKVAISYA